MPTCLNTSFQLALQRSPTASPPYIIPSQFAIVFPVNMDDMRDEVFRRKPEFAALLKAWGDKTLLEYYGQDFLPALTPSKDILDVIESEVAGILGADVATSARHAIMTQGWVNTADHHGLLHNPYFYTTSLALSHKNVCGDALATVALPFGGVSLGNDSFPRGFSFHDSEVNLQKIFFKSLKYRRLPIYSLPPMTKEELQHEKQRATSFPLTKQAHTRLQSFFNALIDDPRVWSQETYSAQLTVMNRILWQQLFGDERGDFVYLEIDSVVRKLLLEKHLLKETDVCNLIFNPKWREKFVELFAGIQGSHDSDSGTHLFWYIDKDALTRRRLIISGDNLITPDGLTTIPFTQAAISEGLRSRTLMPSSALTLIIVQEVENLTCGGGPSQMDYLSSYTARWTQLLTYFDRTGSGEKSVIWCGDDTLFCIADKTETSTELATLVDILLYTEQTSSKIDEALSTTTIAAVVDAMIPSLYSIYTHEETPKPAQYFVPKISTT